MPRLADTSLEERHHAALGILQRTSQDPWELLSYVVWPDGPPPLVSAETSTRAWDEASIIEAIRRWAIEHGSWPRSSEWQMKIDGFPTYTAVRKLFGSWAEALAAAGCDTSRADYLTEVPATPEEAADALLCPVEPTTFADVAEALEAAREQLAEAQSAYASALERFRSHPVLCEIAGEESWSLG